jgi:hypothetical protein
MLGQAFALLLGVRAFSALDDVNDSASTEKWF